MSASTWATDRTQARPAHRKRAAAVLGVSLALSGAAVVVPTAARAASAEGAVFRAKADLDGRTSRDVGNHAYPDLYKRGDKFRVLCQATGGSAYGSTIWDLVSRRPAVFVPDKWVLTGTDSWSSKVPKCSAWDLAASPTPQEAKELAAIRRSQEQEAARQRDEARPDCPIPDLRNSSDSYREALTNILVQQRADGSLSPCRVPASMRAIPGFAVFSLSVSGSASTPIRVAGWQHDRCSSPKMLFPDPEGPVGFSFANACRMHDLGYHAIVLGILPGGAGKLFVDYLFQDMMRASCDLQSKTRGPLPWDSVRNHAICIKFAHRYYLAVKWMGQPKS